MSKKEVYEFTLVLAEVDDQMEGLEDQIFEAGCDDALINFRNGTVYLDFSRESESVEDAVISAIQAVESAPMRAKVISILPDGLVTESEIAKRLDQSRQTVSLWVKRERRKKKPFPNPVSRLSDKSPMWRWYEVLEWLYNQHLIEDKRMLNFAKFIEHINAVLGERDPEIQAYRHGILERLGQQTRLRKGSH